MVEKMTLPEAGFVRLLVVLHHIPVSKTTWWNGVKSGRFPASLKLGEGITVWTVKDVRSLIERPVIKEINTDQEVQKVLS